MREYFGLRGMRKEKGVANIISVIKSRRLKWAGHLARMEEGRSVFKILTGKATGKRP